MLPTCHIHSKSLYGVEVKTSTIPRSGLGLFACNRYGRENKDGDYSPYAVKMSENKYMDCACERGIASYANANPSHNNSRFSVSNTTNTVNLKATKRIRAGQEIFVSYGKNYFKVNNAHHSTVKKKVVEEGKRPCAKCGS